MFYSVLTINPTLKYSERQEKELTENLRKKHLDLLVYCSQDRAIAFDMDISQCCILIAVDLQANL